MDEYIVDTAVIGAQVDQAVEQLMENSLLRPGKILVVGCSTSEVVGQRIGSAGNSEVAKAILDSLRAACQKHRLWLAIQCCEHLNRALVVELDAVEQFDLEPVAVMPVPHAGGALAAQAMLDFRHARVVENVRAQAALDIGGTLIGMHLQPVAVPLRLTIKKIGQASLAAAYSRPKLIGGARAVYVPEDRD